MLRALREHPDVWTPRGETAVFQDPYYQPSVVREFLESLPVDKVCGIKRPDYLALPECAARLAKANECLKVIMVLRDPVERAVSAYHHYIKYDALPLLPFEEGIRKILAGQWEAQWPLAIRVLEYGNYASALRRYLEEFPREQIYIAWHDDFVADTDKELLKLQEFLKLEPMKGFTRRARRRSQAVIYSLARLRFLRLRSPLVFRWAKDRKSWTWKYPAVSKFCWYAFEAADRYLLRHVIDSPKKRLSEEVRVELIDFYRKEMHDLSKLVPLPVGWALRYGISGR